MVSVDALFCGLPRVAAMTDSSSLLSVQNHSRDVAGLRYVYPVISRRAGGVSVGINLNTNNACNWRCVYCQVPDLHRGDAPPVDLGLLRSELSGFLTELQEGAFLRDRVPEDARRIVDVALSGNGEPTSARAFAEVIDVVREVLQARGLLDTIPLRLITNGSRILRPAVSEGLRRMAAASGEIWFKLDAGSPAWISRINNVSVTSTSVAQNLRICASLCPTWVQTCAFRWDTHVPLHEDLDAYLQILRDAGPGKLLGVHLYSLARPSLQPEAVRLQRLSAAELESLAGPIRALGLAVRVSS